jgi:predicted ATP-dependent endonuclease of OLD family
MLTVQDRITLEQYDATKQKNGYIFGFFLLKSLYMKLIELRISNVMSFKFCDSIDDTQPIAFSNDLNVLIGENGAGKTTVLEVVNFLFKQVFLKKFRIDDANLAKEDQLQPNLVKSIVVPFNRVNAKQFRLHPNWNNKNEKQTIFLKVKLDDVDRNNIDYLLSVWPKLEPLALKYSRYTSKPKADTYNEYNAEISFNQFDINIDIKELETRNKLIGTSPFWYLEGYHFFNEIIHLYNLKNERERLKFLAPPASMIGGYRNYNAFSPSISISSSNAKTQLDGLDTEEYRRSLNANERAEPSIFKIVQLNTADKHKTLVFGSNTLDQAEEEANKSNLMRAINEKLKLIGLEARIRCVNPDTWQYTFSFIELTSGEELTDINALSSGQKAIMHLIFESYGRGEIKGGLILIDEPELHLHHQLQNEYLQIVEKIANEQSCQFILVTHSDSFVNSHTMNYIRRLALDENRSTVIFNPELTQPQKLLVQILDNTKSTRAFFGNKVVLVEGETDRYVYTEILNKMHPDKSHDVTILDVKGKGSTSTWKNFFELFGLTIFVIADLDAVFEYGYDLTTSPYRIVTKHNKKNENSKTLKEFRKEFPDYKQKINDLYHRGFYILSAGVLEDYYDPTGQGNKLTLAIDFCYEGMDEFLTNNRNPKSKELRKIFDMIVQN